MADLNNTLTRHDLSFDCLLLTPTPAGFYLPYFGNGVSFFICPLFAGVGGSSIRLTGAPYRKRKLERWAKLVSSLCIDSVIAPVRCPHAGFGNDCG